MRATANMAFGEMDTKRQRAASSQSLSLPELRKMTAVLCDKTKEIIHDYRELMKLRQQ